MDTGDAEDLGDVRPEIAQGQAPLALPKCLGGDEENADDGAADEIEVIEVQGEPGGALADVAHYLSLEVDGRCRVQPAARREDERLLIVVDVDAERVGHEEKTTANGSVPGLYRTGSLFDRFFEDRIHVESTRGEWSTRERSQRGGRHV